MDNYSAVAAFLFSVALFAYVLVLLRLDMLKAFILLAMK
jgi:hypothetical protein